MFNTVQSILDQYIDGISRYNIYSVEMQRGENPEDLFFLCHINNAQYIVFETDYIDSLSQAVKDAARLFPEYSIDSLRWLVKKDHQAELATVIMPRDISVDTKPSRDVLILRPEKSYLRYAILAIEAKQGKSDRHYDPNAYGHTR